MVNYWEGQGHNLSIRCTGHLPEAVFEASVGSVGYIYVNAFRTAINGLRKTEMIHPQGPWRNMQDLTLATFGCVGRLNHKSLHALLGHTSSSEIRETFYARRAT